MWAGVRAVIDWCREVISQAKYDLDTINDLRKQYKDFDPDELW